MEETKGCPWCGQIKSVDDFSWDKKGRGRYHSVCKECVRLRSKEYYAKYQEEKLEKWRIYSLTPKGLYTRLCHSAKHRGIGIEISREEFVDWLSKQAFQCHYCGRGLELKGHRNVCLSFDRKDNQQAYTLRNIALACGLCNRLKSNIFSEIEMLEIAQRYNLKEKT